MRVLVRHHQPERGVIMPTTKQVSGDQRETSAAFKRRFMRRLMAVLLGGMFLDGYILGIIGPVTGTMTADLGLSTLWVGLIAAAALLGIFIGSPLGG
jgi:putative MFS transporter